MPAAILRRRWLIVVVFVCFLWPSMAVKDLTCHPRDLEALHDFVSKLVRKPAGWDLNSSSGCCDWVGITCDSSSSLDLDDPVNTGRITKLELPNRRLSGRLSESLGHLDQIRVLNLTGNFFQDTIPPSIFTLIHLKALDLSFNGLYGQIPEIILLPSLQILDLSFNKFNGTLPAHVCRNSSELRIIRLEEMGSAGDFPSGFGNCLLLEHLNLGKNNLAGNIAEDIFHLQGLKLLNIQANYLSGSLSPAIGNLFNLASLDISFNMFSGEIPDIFNRLPKLQALIAHSNGFLGKIPRSLSKLSSLTLLNLRNNSLSGPLHLNCTEMTNLTTLTMSSNKFTGSLPENLSSCLSLRNIDLSRNTFQGELPQSFKNLHSLSHLSLSNCSLVNISSTLEILHHCKNLTVLILTLNFHGEALPDNPNLRFEKLKVLVVPYCKLRGSIPSWVRKSTNLQILDLSWNHLTDSIPNWFENLTHLFFLDLSNNSFTGEIPKSLTRLPGLINRDISLTEPSIDLTLFMKREERSRALQYNHFFWFPPTLRLSSNNLSGPIWKEFGDLKEVHVFDLKMNRLSGSIPNDLSGMKDLEVLDLSYNNLSGSIPSSLQKLTFLSKFSVAHNNLSGKIPSGGQFPTFPVSSFEGNDNLGMQRQEDGSSDSVSLTSSKTSFARDVAVGMALGFPFGACLWYLFLCKN